MSPWVIVPAGVGLAGVGTAAWGAMHPAAQLFGPTVRHTGRARTLALTFDDGPNPAITPRLLALLDRHGARATFFLIGRFVRACPELVKEITARGHSIGNHTETHPSLLWLSPQRIAAELRRCQDSIAQITGLAPVWMRPPYGIRGPQLDRVVRREGLRGVVMWSVMAKDWRPQLASKVIERLRCVARGNGAAGDDIVVLHDGDHHALGGERQHVVDALDYWLPRWQSRGLEFVTIDEVAGDSSQGRIKESAVIG